MSKKDGKATLVGATEKKKVFVLAANKDLRQRTEELTRACPVKIIRIV